MYCVLCLDPSTRYPISTFQYTATLLRIITRCRFSFLFDDTSGPILAAPQLAQQSATVRRPSGVSSGGNGDRLRKPMLVIWSLLGATTSKGCPLNCTWRTCAGDFISNEHVSLKDNLPKLKLILVIKGICRGSYLSNIVCSSFIMNGRHLRHYISRVGK